MLSGEAITDEEFVEKSVEEMTNDLIARQKQQLFEKYEAKRWNDLEKDAQKFRNLDNYLLNGHILYLDPKLDLLKSFHMFLLHYL